MDQTQFERACAETERLLRRRMANIELVAKRTPEVPYCPEHLLWMLAQCVLFHRDGRTDKANRWLGYAQGVLASVGGADLEELKRANMPDGAQFDAERL